jgi:type I restriction enzyme S subunit
VSGAATDPLWAALAGDCGGLMPIEFHRDGPWDVPEGWVWARLCDLGSWTSGGTPKADVAEYYGGDIPWFRITELNEGRLRAPAKTLTQAGLETSSAKIIQPPFLMFAMYGASIGKMAICEIAASTNQAIACCRPISGIDIDYLFWAIKYSKQNLINQGQGGAQPNISQRILLQHRIPVAPLAEQRRIVARIDDLFTDIADGETALSRARDDLNTWRRALLKSAVTGELTREWRERNQPNETGKDVLARIATANGHLSRQGQRDDYLYKTRISMTA